MLLHVNVETLGKALIGIVPDSFLLATLTTVCSAYYTHAVRFERACVQSLR